MPAVSAELIAQNAQGALQRALQMMGINPYYSTIGRQLMEHAEDMTPLAYSYLGNDPNGMDKFQEFANAYARQMIQGGGAGGGGGGWDLSRGGQRAALTGFQQGATPGTAAYDYFRQGTPNQQFNTWRGFENVARQGQFRPLAEAGLNVEQQRFQDFANRQAADPNYSPNQGWIDYYLGRAGPNAYGGGPGGQPGQGSSPTYAQPGGGTGTTTPPAGGGQTTTPSPTAPPTGGGTTPPPAAAPPAAGAPTSFANANALLNQYRYDQRNWGTRQYGHPGQGFTIGGVTYNPALEQGQGAQRYNNMSGQGRQTARGSAFGVFMYRLDQLRRQRDAGGNAALGITAQTTDDQLARMAAQFIGNNLVGQNPFTIAG